MLLTLAGGVLRLGVFMLFGLWEATAAAVAPRGKSFIPVWLIVAAANLWVGVNHAGYTGHDELPILGIVFTVPALVAALAIWVFSRS